MPFADVRGHEGVKEVLKRLLARKRLPGALLLSGPAGVGKRKLAMEVARSLVCEADADEACGRCGACLRSGKGIHADLFVIEPATATAIKIDQVRDAVRDILSRPFEGRARAFVIDDAHLLTEEASNALLKSLEEPPPTSHVMLVTGAPQALLPTIRSRCQTLRLGGLPPSVVADYLCLHSGLSPEEGRLRAALSGGSLGQALAFESDAYRAMRDGALGWLERISGAAPLVRIEAAQWLEEQEEIDIALLALRALVRDVATVSASGSIDRLLNADVSDRIVKVSQGPLGARAIDAFEAVVEARTALRGNANKALAMDVLVDGLAG